MLELIHKGQVLSAAQVATLEQQSPEMFSMSPRNFRKAIDIALKNAGHPVPDIEPGQVVTWEVRGVKDKGRVVSFDERADKYRVTSKLRGRDVTITGREIRVLVKEEA